MRLFILSNLQLEIINFLYRNLRKRRVVRNPKPLLLNEPKTNYLYHEKNNCLVARLSFHNAFFRFSLCIGFR